MPVADGQRFCLLHPARGNLRRGMVVYIHPFAEEMNKTRRMAALQSRALADAGFTVLQLDLLGCGDSSGDFADARWRTWVTDIVQACEWLRQKSLSRGLDDDAHTLWLWGLRAGCLLSMAAAEELPYECNFLFWQPCPSGKTLLQQFLRIKTANRLLNGDTKSAMNSVRKTLAAGLPVEIGGYMLSAELALALEHAVLEPPSRDARSLANPQLVWLELTPPERSAWSPASAKAIQQWELSGYQVHREMVTGPAFWQTSEVQDAPALITKTTAALGHAGA